MRKTALVLLLVAAVSTVASQLPLSHQAEQEADFYLSFLEAAFEKKKTEEICASYAELLHKQPRNKYLRRQMMLCALEKKDLTTAQSYADFFEQEENDGEDLAAYAFYLWQKGQLSQAQQYYEQALEAMPDDSRILYQYLLMLSAMDIDKAVEKLQERKSLYPTQAALLDYETGNLYLKRGQWQRALEYYKAAKEANPQAPEPYLIRAEIYEKTNQFFLMLHELEELEQMGYKSAGVYARMGSVYVLVKDHARAKQYFLKAKEVEPNNISAGYFLALYAESEKDFPQAARYLRETADFPTDAGKWLQVSFYEQQAADTAGALRTLQTAHRIFDKNVEIGYFYGLLLQETGQNKQAARVFKKVLDSNPSYENARLAYAFSLESMGKLSQMEEQVRLILEQNPRNAMAYNLLGFSLADRNIRLQEALELVTKAVELNPQDNAFQDSLAWVYYRLGQPERALELLQALPADFVEKNSEVGYHIGAVHTALGQTEQALLYLRPASAGDKNAAKLLKKLSK